MDDIGWLLNGPVLLFLSKGLLNTILLTAVCACISLFFGILIAAGRTMGWPIVSYPCLIYTEVLRGLPVLLLIFAVYFGSGEVTGVGFTPMIAGVVALSAYTSAVVAEIVRAGLKSVETNTVQAAEAQGFSGSQIFFMIRLPVALRRMSPALVTQLTSLVKTTSLVVVIGLPEFLHHAMIVASAPPFRAIPVYLLVGIVYFLVNITISSLGRKFTTRDIGGIARVSR